MSVIGKNILKYRTERKLTQEELAKRVGTNTNRIGRIERGEVTNPRNLELYAKALNVSIDDLVNDLQDSEIPSLSGDEIRALRIAQNISSEQLAAMVGSSVGTIHRIEADETPNSKYLRDIFFHLGVIEKKESQEYLEALTESLPNVLEEAIQATKSIMIRLQKYDTSIDNPEFKILLAQLLKVYFYGKQTGDYIKYQEVKTEDQKQNENG